ncbi:MAG TPA: zinc ABC transporter permease AztB [Acidimicrobiia bacterium]|jgi:manganese/iron transport system permease protein|nr:zinc ABC transporter permease AztB [Acidimicrobiia bacterium]
MDWLVAPFELAFQQRALLAGSLAALALALVGVWVVIRGMSFLGDALVHGVVPGIALAVLFDFSPIVGAVLAALVMLAGINLVHRQTKFSEDTSIGLLFVGMLGLGVIIISRADSYTGSLTAVLFGDALGVSGNDLWLLGGLLVVTLIATALLYRPFLVLSFNEQKAALLGLRPRLAHFALLALVTLSIVASFRTVGTLLVFGLLVGPAATAALLVRRVPMMMLTSAVIGVLSVAVGLTVSYHANTSGSATMAVVPIAFFFIALGLKSIRTGVAT